MQTVAWFVIRELKQKQQRRQRKCHLKITTLVTLFAITSTHLICTKTGNNSGTKLVGKYVKVFRFKKDSLTKRKSMMLALCAAKTFLLVIRATVWFSKRAANER